MFINYFMGEFLSSCNFDLILVSYKCSSSIYGMEKPRVDLIVVAFSRNLKLLHNCMVWTSQLYGLILRFVRFKFVRL